MHDIASLLMKPSPFVVLIKFLLLLTLNAAKINSYEIVLLPFN